MKHPRALHLLNFVSMWEYFSYYGMRALLVLFMVQVLRYDDSSAFGLYAIYITLVELCGMLGGIAADRVLGLRRAISLGGWTIALGHICMAIPDVEETMFLGLGLIVVGTGLFRSNAATLLGQFYEKDDPRRESGYTLYYTGISIGGFLASALCGIVGEVYGWHLGFGLAALGMISGNVALMLGRNLLGEKGESAAYQVKNKNIIAILGLILATPVTAFAIYQYHAATPLIPVFVALGLFYVFRQIRGFSLLEKERVYRLVLYVAFLVIFYGIEEQLGSSLIMFAERHVDRQTWFGVFPAASLIMFNPFTALITGPLLARLIQRFPLRGLKMIGIAFFLLGLGFCVLFTGCISSGTGVSLGYVIASCVIIAMAELFIGPTVYAYASEVAPRHFQGLIMGIVALGFALANLFSGWISQMMVVGAEESSIEVYSGGFALIGVFAIILGFALFLSRMSQERIALSH